MPNQNIAHKPPSMNVTAKFGKIGTYRKKPPRLATSASDRRINTHRSIIAKPFAINCPQKFWLPTGLAIQMLIDSRRLRRRNEKVLIIRFNHNNVSWRDGGFGARKKCCWDDSAGQFRAATASYSPNDDQVIGTINSGQTSPREYAHTSKYQALVFEGNGHDRVEVTVTGAKAYVALADSTLTPIAGGVGRLNVALPYHGPDTEAFYILVKSLTSQPARLSVHLQKSPANAPRPSDATR